MNNSKEIEGVGHIDFMDVEKTVFEQITAKCKLLGISVSELCRRANVDRGYIHKLKVGETIAVKNIKLLIKAANEIECENSEIE